eukprot:5699420-Pyramimonas_sp.AAC.1
MEPLSVWGVPLKMEPAAAVLTTAYGWVIRPAFLGGGRSALNNAMRATLARLPRAQFELLPKPPLPKRRRRHRRRADQHGRRRWPPR